LQHKPPFCDAKDRRKETNRFSFAMNRLSSCQILRYVENLTEIRASVSATAI